MYLSDDDSLEIMMTPIVKHIIEEKLANIISQFVIHFYNDDAFKAFTLHNVFISL